MMLLASGVTIKILGDLTERNPGDLQILFSQEFLFAW